MARETAQRFAPPREARTSSGATSWRRKAVGAWSRWIVLDPCQPTRFRTRDDLGPADRKQRPVKAHMARRQRAKLGHRRHALQSGAAHELQEHGLCLVVQVMRERNVGLGPRGVDRITQLAGGGLDSIGRLAIHVHAFDREWHLTRRAEIAAELRPAFGIGAQSMVDMHGSDRARTLSRHRIEQHDGIDAARETDAHPLARR
jgi:hypothetical protein